MEYWIVDVMEYWITDLSVIYLFRVTVNAFPDTKDQLAKEVRVLSALLFSFDFTDVTSFTFDAQSFLNLIYVLQHLVLATGTGRV